MSHHYISTAAELRHLLGQLQDIPVIAYDTEFISENRYYPQLCLVQIAAGDIQALIDPFSVGSLDAFWELLCDGRHEIVVHACRSEMEFCFRAINRLPTKLFDVQVAAGFLGNDYPAGYGTLLERFLKISLPKAESRTVWNKRPLAALQIEYALGDVHHLEQLAKTLQTHLVAKKRIDWYAAEMERIKQGLQYSFETPRWRSLPKISSLKPRELAIARELWFWRENIARKRNLPASRVLRDDLVVEIARRGTSDEKRIAAVRGMQRSDAPKILPEISETVNRALAIPQEECPLHSNHFSFPQYSVMAQFLSAALCSICQQHHISPQLVGGPVDIRELIAAELGTLPPEINPRLLDGWRAKLVGSLLDDLIKGRISIQIKRNTPENPLVFVKNQEAGDVSPEIAPKF
ncbi:MAG: HRDC domain-containing protein [Planctomycetaceae bacterium]|jgi:ribonuclease D|nr:HRDC domain-containing protein [Planctomycetaceae bacterium]